MNNIFSNVGQGFEWKYVYVFLSLGLGVTGVGLGVLHLRQAKNQISDNSAKLLQEIQKMQGFKYEIEGIRKAFNTNNKAWKDDLFAKELDNQQTLEGLTAKIDGILDTKKETVDLSPVFAKIEENHKVLFTEVNENYEAVIDTLTDIKDENLMNHKDLKKSISENKDEIISSLGSEMLSQYNALHQTLNSFNNNVYNWFVGLYNSINKPEIEAQVLIPSTVSDDSEMRGIGEKLDKVINEIKDINAFNEQNENKQKAINTQLMNSSKMLLMDFEDIKNNQESLNSYLRGDLKESIDSLEREIWTLGDDMGIYVQELKRKIKRELERFKSIFSKFETKSLGQVQQQAKVTTSYLKDEFKKLKTSIAGITKERGEDLETFNQYIILLGDLVNNLTPSVSS